MAEFLVDRSLGRHVVPNAVRAQGHTVHTLWSVYGDAEQDLADTEFLGDAGRHGWAVLTGDMRIRRVAHELAVVEAEGVRMFALPRGHLRGVEQAARFVDNLPAILRACDRPGPYIYAVLRDRIERRWP
ncbi:MAG: toxin-antitoxin system, toxin component, PIN family protein [Actinomycetota bacterium]|nr:toxin-antitoxin system, toxin component, PIN family protein [Euzebyaceae bacterium]MDQ3453703.1 toxin-antitoxin system, toxin component, PIN family protein [Actinomycetota bacterium]